MSNWVEIKLKLLGSPENIKKFVDDFEKEGFNCAAPIPPFLKSYRVKPHIWWEIEEKIEKFFPTDSFSSKQSAELNICALKMILPTISDCEVKKAIDKVIKCIEKTGYACWYQFVVINWGTDRQPWDIIFDEKKNILTFYTAWSPPVPFLTKASRKYDINFRLVALDMVSPFLEQREIKNGKEVFYKDYTQLLIQAIIDYDAGRINVLDLSEVYSFLK